MRQFFIFFSVGAFLMLLSSCKKSSAPKTLASQAASIATLQKFQHPKKQPQLAIENDPGIGPVSANFQPLFQKAEALEGRKLFSERCTTCHSLSNLKLGPPLGEIVKKRQASWIMNMMLNPVKMVEKNRNAKKLSELYPAQMVSVVFSEKEARSIYQYLREEAKKK